MKHRLATALLLAILAFNACASGPAVPAATDAPTAISTPTPKPTATPEPSPTPVPSDTPTPAPMTPSDLFDKVSPSVAFIETERGSGSGVLIDDGYIITNAHVVWPFTEVRVVFPDGSEFTDAPVLAWDLIGDLAVLGPIETDLPPVSFLTDERLLVGKDVFLIGYPGEVEKFPQPTISRGLVSRLRNWPAIDMTYLQTDATIAGGQSGGVLVSDRGEIAGISGNSFPDTSFALVASAQDVLKRVDGLIAGDDVDGLGQRPLMNEKAAATSHMITLQNDLDSKIFAVRGEKGDEVEIDLESIRDLAIWVVDMYGNVLAWQDDTTTGRERDSFELLDDGLHFVGVYKLTDQLAVGTLTSNVDLIPLTDPDDQKRPVLGETISGDLDHPGDIDSFRLFLKKNQEINIRAESVMIDPLVSVHMQKIFEDYISRPANDDGGGGGLFSRDAELSYRAPEDGIYFIIVEDAIGVGAGGYLLTVKDVEAGDPTPMAPEPTPTPIISAHGPMTQYQSEGSPAFRIQHPADWRAAAPASDEAALCRLVDYCRFADEGEVMFMIVVEHLDGPLYGNMTLQDYVELQQQILKTQPGDLELLHSEEIVTAGGLPVYILEYEGFGGIARFKIFTAMQDGAVFKATLTTSAVWPGADEETAQAIERSMARIDEVTEYMINTLEVTD